MHQTLHFYVESIFLKKLFTAIRKVNDPNVSLKGNDLDAKPNLIRGNVAGVGKPRKGENHRWGTNNNSCIKYEAPTNDDAMCVKHLLHLATIAEIANLKCF